MKKLDLTGRVFGDLIAVRPGQSKKIGRKQVNRSTWVCRCICGKEIEILTHNLLRPPGKSNSTSCGCKFLSSKKYNFTDLTDKTYGMLLVKKKAGYTKTRGVIWQCLCKCGNTINVASNSLTSGNTLTCKSAVCRIAHRRVGEIPLAHINAIRQNATKRCFEYSVTPEYLWDIFINQNRTCPLSGEQLCFTDKINAQKDRPRGTNASLDRIDNAKGYVEGNVRWIHKTINKMRSNMSDEEFIEWCRKCFLYQYPATIRPNYHEYFMLLSFNVSLRSDDQFIKHGAIIVDNKSKHIIATGFNGTFRGCDTKLVNISERDIRRPWMIHAEENAIMNCRTNPLELPNGASIYVTGLPCVICLQRVINFGITDVYFAKRAGSITENTETQDMRNKIISMNKISLKEIDTENIWIKRSCI